MSIRYKLMKIHLAPKQKAGKKPALCQNDRLVVPMFTRNGSRNGFSNGCPLCDGGLP